MADFNRDNRSGGNRSYSKPRFNNDRGDRPEMHQATCASCGKPCEVPFRPNGSRPVLCRDCFQKDKGSDSRGFDNRSDSRSSDRPRTEDRQMYDATCSNCGDKCQIPFRPTQGRDVFCSRCFDMQSGSDSRGADRRPERKSFDRPTQDRDDNRGRINDAPNYKAQFEALNAKMDRILSLLSPASVEIAPLESAMSEEAIEEIVEEIKEEKAAKKQRKAKAAPKKAAPKAKKASTKAAKK